MRLAAYVAVSQAVVDDAPALRCAARILEAKLAAAAHERGLVLVSTSCELTSPTFPELWVDDPVSWPRRIIRKMLRRPAGHWAPAPLILRAEAIADELTDSLSLTWGQILSDGPMTLLLAAELHQGCAYGGVFAGTVDGGGYARVECLRHGVIWQRAGSS